MQPLFTFSTTDHSIDIIGGLLFVGCIYLASKYIKKNSLNQQGYILYILVALISAMHVVQVLLQLFEYSPSSFSIRFWDFINYLTAMLFLMTCERIHRREQRRKKDIK